MSVEQARNEIDPALVDEPPAVGLDYTFSGDALHPPVEKTLCVIASADSQETEVVHPRDEDRVLGQLVGLTPGGVGDVRRQHDAVLAGELLDLVERSVDLDVGVEVGGDVPAVREQPPEQPRLHCGRELEDVVDHRHPPELLVVEPDLRRKEGLEGLPFSARRSRRVDHEHREARIGMMDQERLGEHAGMRQIVSRDDRAGFQGGSLGRYSDRRSWGALSPQAARG